MDLFVHNSNYHFDSVFNEICPLSSACTAVAQSGRGEGEVGGKGGACLLALLLLSGTSYAPVISFSAC